MKNISWTTLSMVLRVVFAGGALALLGRMVSPATMGIYGMGWAAASLGFTISQSGAAQGIIALREIEKEHLSAAQMLSCVISVVFGLLLIAVSPAIQAFYRHPGIALAFVLSGLFVPLMGLGATDVAHAQKNLQFSLLAVIQTGAIVLSSTSALILAYFGQGLLALYCLQGLVGFFTFLLFRCSGRQAHFGRTTMRHVKEVWRIGMHLSLGSLTSVVWQSVPQLVLAKVTSVEDTGLYVFCNRIIQIIYTQLSNMVNTVVYPTFARFRSDPAQVGRAYLRTVRFTYFCLMLPLIPLATSPSAFLRFYGGGQWTAGGQILLYLVISQMVLALGANAFPTFMALGRPEVAWQWNLFIMTVQTVAILITAHSGILMVVKGVACSACVMPLAIYWLSFAARFRFLDYWKGMAVMLGFVAPAIAFGVFIRHLVTHLPAVAVFFAAGACASLIYSCAIILADRDARSFLRGAVTTLRTRFGYA